MEESKSSIVYHIREALKHCKNVKPISHLTYEQKDDGKEIVEIMYKTMDIQQLDVTKFHGIEMLTLIVNAIKNYNDLW